MDPIPMLKAYAQKIGAHQFGTTRICHGQALEIAVSLVSEAHSWNEFAARPRAPLIPGSVEAYFKATVTTQRRIQELHVAPLLGRGARSMLAIDCLAAITDTIRHPLRLLWKLMDNEDVRNLGVADKWVLSHAKLDNDPSVATFRLANWFFEKKVGLDCKYGFYPWDATKKLAIAMGFSDTETWTIREVQREAPNHCWNLDLWCEVGVLDPDQRAFLEELRAQPDWMSRFRTLYETDGGRA